MLQSGPDQKSTWSEAGRLDVSTCNLIGITREQPASPSKLGCLKYHRLQLDELLLHIAGPATHKYLATSSHLLLQSGKTWRLPTEREIGLMVQPLDEAGGYTSAVSCCSLHLISSYNALIGTRRTCNLLTDYNFLTKETAFYSMYSTLSVGYTCAEKSRYRYFPGQSLKSKVFAGQWL